MTQNHLTKDPNEHITSLATKESVAVIGAGFAGLSCANVLLKSHQSQSHEIDFTMYDSGNPPPQEINNDHNNNKDDEEVEEEEERKINAGLFFGELELPAAKQILEKLHLYDDYMKLINKKSTTTYSNINRDSDLGSSSMSFPRELLLHILRKSIPSEIIKYKKQLVKITYHQSNNNNNNKNNIKMYCHFLKVQNKKKKMKTYWRDTRNDDEDEEDVSLLTTVEGPFDYIIGADGVWSNCKKLSSAEFIHNNNNKDKIFLIGDARWVSEHWYHLGMSRIRRGANTAIQDGYELGQHLLELLLKKDDDCDEKEKRNLSSLLSKYSAYELWKWKMIRRLCVFVCIVSVLVAKMM